MSFVFIPLSDIKYKDLEIYYKKEIITELTKFDLELIDFQLYKDKYIYYYEPPFVSCEKKCLGKFKRLTKINIGTLYGDYDYDAYEFENDTIISSRLHLIYYKGIPDIYTNMKEIDDITYREYPVYYKK